jgi:hypothetical protein
MVGKGDHFIWFLSDRNYPQVWGTRPSVELIVRVIACLAEGLGIRGTARVFEVDPNTVLQWLVEAAEQLRAFSQHGLRSSRRPPLSVSGRRKSTSLSKEQWVQGPR